MPSTSHTLESEKGDIGSPRAIENETQNTLGASIKPDEKTPSTTEKAVESLPPLPRKVTGFKWVLVVFSILSSTFLFSLDNTIFADVQPAIVRQFASVDNLSWLSVAFLLGASGTNLFW